MRIVIDTNVDSYAHALATVRAAYDVDERDGGDVVCPVCGARNTEPCRTKWGKRASKWHTSRSRLIKNS